MRWADLPSFAVVRGSPCNYCTGAAVARCAWPVERFITVTYEELKIGESRMPGDRPLKQRGSCRMICPALNALCPLCTAKFLLRVGPSLAEPAGARTGTVAEGQARSLNSGYSQRCQAKTRPPMRQG